MHAKVWIFDDRFAIVGSANCNRRSYTCDSEFAAGIFDENRAGNRVTFAHRLRMELWKRAFNVPPITGMKAGSVTDADVMNFIASSSRWHSPAPDATIELYDTDPSHSAAKDHHPDGDLVAHMSLVYSLDRQWNTMIDPDGS